MRPFWLEGFVAGAGGTAFEVVDFFAVRSERFEGMLTPEGTIVAVLDVGVPVSFDVTALPAQHGTTVHADFGQARAFHNQAFAVFTASSSARFTATFARVTL